MIRIAPLTQTSGPFSERSRGRLGLNQAECDIDFALAQRCREGDADALRLLVDRHQERVFGFLNRLLGSREDAEDATLDVFVNVWRHAGQFRGQSSAATWIYRIAANIAADHLRRAKARTGATGVVDCSEDAATDPERIALAGLEQGERSRALDLALQSLRPDDRLLLMLYYAEEMSYEQIGQIANCAYPVLKMRLLRARKRLKAAMERLGLEDN